MEWFKLRTYARRRQKHVHFSSPVPGVVGSVPRGSSKARALQPCQRLFAPPFQESQARRNVKGNPSVKALSKIKENFEVTQMNSSSHYSDQLNDQTITAMEENEGIQEKSTTLKAQIMHIITFMDEVVSKSETFIHESLLIHSESKESLRNSETTSGMTLPTGVSTFLLDCLDMDSSTESMDSINSCPSPEIFRDEDSLDGNNSNPEECLKYKNSTLLDSSKAVTIDKMPQLSNLSEILEPVSEGHQDQSIWRKTPLKCNEDPSELMTVSTVVSGKQVCKIMSTKEKTPDVKIGTLSSLPERPKRQLGNQTAKPKNLKCQRKVKFSSLSETSSCHRFVSPAECISTKSHELMADVETEMLSKGLMIEKHRALLTSTACFQPEELESSLGEDLFLNSTGPYVNSEEIAPASLSSEEKTIYQSLQNKETQNKKSNTKKKEICSIIKTSPEVRLAMVHQTPGNGNVMHPTEGIPEDVITSTKNWVYGDHG